VDLVYVTSMGGQIQERGGGMALAEGILGWTSSEELALSRRAQKPRRCLTRTRARNWADRAP
jgi:hypothetical protein